MVTATLAKMARTLNGRWEFSMLFLEHKIDQSSSHADEGFRASRVSTRQSLQRSRSLLEQLTFSYVTQPTAASSGSRAMLCLAALQLLAIDIPSRETRCHDWQDLQSSFTFIHLS